MAHDFGIMNKRTRRTEWFFGYAKGVMYSAFNAWEHNAWSSGDGYSTEISYEEAKDGLDYAIWEYDHGYPGSAGMDEIKAFRRAMEDDDKADTYIIAFQ